MKEHKIFLEKEDDIDEVVSHIKSSKADKVILNIPKDSILKSSLDNFHRLKRESLQADKDLEIESVDPHIEELADLSKIDCINPVFGKKEKFVADIIPRHKKRDHHKPYSDSKNKAENDFLSGDFLKKNRPKKKSFKLPKLPKLFKRKDKPKKVYRSFSFKNIFGKWLPITITLVILGALYFVGFHVLPQANINLSLQEFPITIDETITVDVNIPESNLNEDNEITLPGEIISNRMNHDISFSATGEGDIERHATGDVYIYNEYGDSSITLVEQTRLETPNGLIYKTNEEVVISPTEDPENPARVQVKVTAAQPGKQHNTSNIPDEVWTIPGFQEDGLTEMFDGFYGEPASTMSGGLIGSSKYPTDEDIANAEEKIEQSIRASLENQILITGSADFKLLNDASEFQLLEKDINQTVNEEGEFTVFIDAQMRNFVFERGVLNELLIQKLSDKTYPIIVVDQGLQYENISIDWDTGVMTFDITGTITTKPKLDKDQFIRDITNKGEIEIEDVIKKIPDLKNAKISLWPFWVKVIPDNLDKVTVTVQ